jgi:hypothetical protein
MSLEERIIDHLKYQISQAESTASKAQHELCTLRSMKSDLETIIDDHKRTEQKGAA